MSKWVYIRSESGLWTVGHYSPDCKWEPESDHRIEAEAAKRVHYLNGGDSTPKDPFVLWRGAIKQMTIAMVAGMMLPANKESEIFDAVNIARKIVQTVYETESE